MFHTLLIASNVVVTPVDPFPKRNHASCVAACKQVIATWLLQCLEIMATLLIAVVSWPISTTHDKQFG